MARDSPLSSTSIPLSEQHSFFQYSDRVSYHGLLLFRTHSMNLPVSMSTNMPITIRSRLHFNSAPFGAFKPHKPPSHIRVVVPLNFNLKPSYCTWTLVFT